MPGPAPLRRVLRAAERRRADVTLVRQAEATVDEFERIIETEAGDRAGLDAMISAFLPEARDKYELASKQAAFRGMSQIKGVAMEANILASFRHPSADGKSVDTATLFGHIDLRRVRPAAPIYLVTGDHSSSGSHSLPLTDERASHGADSLLPQFSTTPLPKIQMQEVGELAYFTVASHDVGLRSGVDLVFAERRMGLSRRYREPGGRTHTGLLQLLNSPAKRTTVDMFVHQDLYPGVQPELAMYDTTGDGAVTVFNDPAREHDRIQLHETIRPMGRGLAHARLGHIRRYVEMLEFVCGRMGWDPGEFRGYRLDVDFPVHGAQYMIAFKLPEAPEATGA
jgi:hypothetical protein